MLYERDRNHDILEFTIFCIENVADRLSKDSRDVYVALKNSGIIDDNIIPSYDVLHTQGKDYIVSYVIERMKDKGVTV